ncbi:MAG: PKD domain-containing protein [Thermodesulfobacteriota bacterium]|nr:PKD domain-containing protein [Thermodesulfobacteriota bacterium]
MSAKKIVVCVALVFLLPVGIGAEESGLEDINFPFDSSVVVDDLEQISWVSQVLQSDRELFLEIGGHSDALGADEYNRGLSSKRALSVKKKLTEQGVPPERIRVEAHGEEFPKVGNETKAGRFQNRRVVFSIYKMDHGKKVYFYKDNTLVRPLAVAGPSIQPSGERVGEKTKVIRLGDHKAGLSVGIGSDDGDLTGTLDGRLFFPFHEKGAFQGGVKANINDTLREYQVDAGMVGKHQRFQVGLFGSLKLADLEDYDDMASLSQVSLVGSYLYDWGSVGVYMTEALDSDDDISSTERYVDSDLFVTDTYMKVRDKYGLHFDYAFENGLLVDGDLGVVRADDDEATGHLKAAYPFVKGTNAFVLTSYNSGYMEDDSNYAVVVGVELGSWTCKRGGPDEIRPMQVPEVSYELETRTDISEEAANKPPRQVAIIASPVGGSPFALSFTGSATDPDGYIAYYGWDFGDGTTGSGEAVRHTYQVPGIYVVNLTATDNHGAGVSFTQEVRVPVW